jgi:antitoxin MazE
MEVNIIQIGNSKGLRLSKAILEQYNIQDKVEMVLERGRIILKPIHAPRENWDQAFAQMNQRGDDQLLIDLMDDEHLEPWS